MLVLRGLIGGLLQLALPALLLPLALLVARITVEEETLGEALPGHADYTRRVRYRLVPFLW